jgi:hypothetical protein
VEKTSQGTAVKLSRLYLSKQWDLRKHFIARLLFISTSSFRADLLLHGLADQPCNSDCSGSSVAFQGEIQLYNCTEPQRLISIYRCIDSRTMCRPFCRSCSNMEEQVGQELLLAHRFVGAEHMPKGSSSCSALVNPRLCIGGIASRH